MKRVEVILCIAVVFSITLNLLLVPGGEALTVILLSMLAIFYMYLSFALFNNIPFKRITKKDSYREISTLRIIGLVGLGIALSLTLIGILFKIMQWPGANANLATGLILLLLAFLVSVFRYIMTKSEIYINVFKRTIVYGIFGIVLFAINSDILLDFKYRNHPRFLEALKKAKADPKDPDLWKNVDQERRLMNNGK